MAMDMSDALTDPDMLDKFNVIRRPETVSVSSGLGSTIPTTFKNIRGVVSAAHGNDLERLDDADRMGRNISVVTQFALRGPSKDAAGQDYKPDLIVWRGGTYVVKTLDPYPQFGPGFVQAIAGATEVVDVAT